MGKWTRGRMRYSDDLKNREFNKLAVKQWQRKKRKNDRMEILKSVMRNFPDQVAIEIIERHTELKQTFTEIAHVLGLDRHTVSYKFKRATERIKARVEAREKL